MGDTLKTQVRRVGDCIGGYGVVFGDQAHRDLEGDYFTRDTEFWLDTYRDQPVLYDHAMGYLPPSISADMPSRFKFGRVVKVTPDEVGLWIEAQITEHGEWVDAVLALIERGVLHWSSGAVSHLVKREQDGQLSSWPIIEWSTTPTPAEPRQTNVVRLKHLVQDQDGDQRTPEAQADKAAPASDTAPVIDSQSTNGDTAVTLKLNDLTVKALVSAYADSNVADIQAAIDAVKQEGGGENMIAQALQPLADQLAEMAGADAESTLAYLIAWVAEHAATEAPEPEAEPEPLPEMVGDVLSVNQGALDAAVQKAVAKAMQSDKPRGGALTPQQKNIQLGGRAEKPLTLGRWIKAVANHDHATLNQHHGRIKAAYKALGIDPDTAGGYLVPVEQSNQVIELLRASAKVLPLCRTLPMNSATLSIPTQTGGATAYWVGENASITDSEQTFGQKLLVAKKLGVFVKVSNELLEDSDPAIDAVIREDIARVSALAVDSAILTGSGINGEPLGILGSGATATPLNAAPTYDTLSAAVSRVEVENVMEEPTWQWVFSPREKDTLRQLEDTAGNLIYAGPGAYQQAAAGPLPGTLLGFPWQTTTQIAVDANSETRMFFGQWQDVIVGQRKTLEIMASSEAGDAFQYDQTWIRAVLRLDVVLRHPESIEILTDVQV